MQHARDYVHIKKGKKRRARHAEFGFETGGREKNGFGGKEGEALHADSKVPKK